MSDRTCSVEDCEKPACVRGWCRAHYERWRRRGDVSPETPLRPRMWELDCSVDGCDHPARLRGWCNAHYQRWRVHGDPTAGGRLRDGRRTPCSVDGCERQVVAWGWCEAHYRRWRRTGDIGVSPVRELGSGEDVSYNTAHRRVAEAKGRAALHICVECGGQAQEWAYDHADPNVRIASGNPRIEGMLYSLNPDHYQPMCKSCHQSSLPLCHLCFTSKITGKPIPPAIISTEITPFT